MNLGRENEVLEFKETTRELTEAIIDIVAILNKHNRGTLYFGVKNNGDVVVLDLMYYPNEVNEYLVNESKLDSPSTHRYHMLEIFEENGEFYFTLNLQVRYK